MTFHVSLSTGTGFTTQVWGEHVWNSVYASYYFRDMNGDKLLDLLVQECSQCETTRLRPGYSVSTYEDNTVFVYLNTGTGFGTQQVWANYTNTFVDLADMDGDGLTDLVENGDRVRLNDGSGFGVAEHWPISGVSGTSDVSFLDYNGDGKADRVWVSTTDVHYNTGGSFILGGESGYVPHVDFNGDGQRDRYTRSILDNYTYYGKATISLHLLRDNMGLSTPHAAGLAVFEYGLNRFLQAADVNGDGIYELTVGKTWECVPKTGYPSYNPGKWCDDDKVRVYHSEETHLHLLKTITSGQSLLSSIRP